MRDLPIYKLNISMTDESSGVEFVALVDKPAIDEIGYGSGLFLKFSDEKYTFKATDEEKQIVSGPLLVPDAPIYRNEKGQEFYVEFSKESIYNIIKKFFKQGNTSNVNKMHDAKQIAQDVYMIESFIIDRSKMSPPIGFEDLPDGAWFGSYKVDDATIWNEIKAGKFKGFSVEGMFIPEGMKDAALISQIEAILRS